MAEDIVDESLGYINSNVRRKQVFDIIDKNGGKTEKELGKMTRIPGLSLRKMLGEMVEKGLLKLDGEKYAFTEMGNEVATLNHGSTKAARSFKTQKHEDLTPKNII
jgi:predicted transcriptional regulator